jgi:predicted DNA-binding protein (MmcQ/YjbR family)
MTVNEFRNMALSFPGTEENAHFDRAAFKVVKKRIFATLHEASKSANLKLTPKDQKLYCQYDKNMVFAVPNKWGVQGWTTFDLKRMPAELMLDALNAAYREALNPSMKKKSK